MTDTKTEERKGLKRKLQTPFKSPFQSKHATSGVVKDDGELKQRLDAVTQQVEQLRAQGLREEELQTHMDKMHEYNEIKDVGQMVLGRLANLEGLCTKDLYDKYGLDLED